MVSSATRIPPKRIPGESRSAAVRRYRIHQIFVRDKFTNCTKLATEFEVGVRTILRDIEVMRSQDFPIDYDPVRKAYFYSEPVFNLPSVQVSRSGLRAIRAAAKAVGHHQCATMKRQLSRILGILLSGVSACGRSLDEQIDETTFSFCGPVCPFNATAFDQLEKAIGERAEIEFEYQKPSVESQKYCVRPYFLSSRENIFYLVAEDVRSNSIKLFVVARIVRFLRRTGRHFVRPSRLSPEKYFKNAFRVFPGEETQRVSIRGSAMAAPYLCERLWHASQRITPLADGGVFVEFDVADLRDIRSWIFRWGPEVEVITPAGLRTEVAQALASAARLYQE